MLYEIYQLKVDRYGNTVMLEPQPEFSKTSLQKSKIEWCLSLIHFLLKLMEMEN